MTTTHLGDAHIRGPLCGLKPEPGGSDRISNESADVDCHHCLSMLGVMRHHNAVPHPQPVKVRVYELAKQAGLGESRLGESRRVLRVLGNLGYQVKAPASALRLEGFEHQALVAMLADL